MEARALRAVLGEGARRVREAAGVRQIDISRHARTHGLAWSRAKVAALEAGEKAISAEDLALLPLVLSDACARPVVLADLIPPEARISLSPSVPVTGEALLKIYASADLDDVSIDDLGPNLAASLAGVFFPGNRPEAAQRRYEALWQRTRAVQDRMGELVSPGTSVGQLRDLIGGSPGESERHAAKRLGEDPRVILGLSRLLWGRSLSEQRDLLIDERPDAGDDPERLRALRGRMTRVLVDLLEIEIRRRDRDGEEDDVERQEET